MDASGSALNVPISQPAEDSNRPPGQQQCSVRGCTLPIDPALNNKMCDACRSRHRIYASTKRARRKQEKAALVGVSDPAAPTPTWALWGHTAIDPQLFAEPVNSMYYAYASGSSTSSELAGALTLPMPTSTTSNATAATATAGSMPSRAPEHDEEREMVLQDGTDPRECSVRGCTMLIPSVYKYKMCTSCRTRYRTYGTTKRAKWKAEREAFDRELVGTMSGPPLVADSWEISMIDENVTAENKGYASGHSPTGPARMCTVSHCRELLPATHRYKRCDQHRLQNRHHSQLKRTRELKEKEKEKEREREEQKHKEEEAAAQENGSDTDIPAEAEAEAEAEIAQQENEEETQQEDDASDDKNIKVRKRSNYTCSSTDPPCANLLAPDVRWRHCEVCRARARINRREGREAARGVTAELERLREIVRRLGGEEKVRGAVEDAVGKEQEEKEREVEKVEEDGVADAGSPIVAQESSSNPAPSADLNATANVTAINTPTTDHPYATTATPPAPSIPVPVPPPAPAPVLVPKPSPKPSPKSAFTPGPALVHAPTPAPAPPAENALSYSYPYPQTFQSVFRANLGTPAVPHPVSSSNPAPNNAPSTTSTTNTTAPGELTFMEYKPKPPKAPVRKAAAGPALTRVGHHQQTSVGASYHVYKTTPMPVPTSVSAPTNKKQKTGDGSTSTSTSQQPSSSTVIPRQRKPPRSTPTHPPAPPTQQHLHGHAAYPYAPYTSPYPTSQYPYPYYVPHGASPSYTYPPLHPHSPHPSHSHARPSPSPSSSSPYPYPYTYPYAYAYPPYAYPYPAPQQGYVPPRYAAGAGYPSEGGGRGTRSGREVAFSYYQPSVSSVGGPAGESEKILRKRKRGDWEREREKSRERERERSRERERERERERQREKEKGPGGVSSTSTIAISNVDARHLPREHPPPPHVVATPFTLQPSNASREVFQSLASAPASAPPISASPAQPQLQPQPQQHQAIDSPNINTTATMTTNTAQSQPPAPAQEIPPKPQPERACANKSCHRSIPVGVTGTLCERCRVRMKKHQKKARQRMRLEPRKSLLKSTEEKVEAEAEVGAGAGVSGAGAGLGEDEGEGMAFEVGVGGS
ncbi:hypothetical protein C0995_000204 [Termitomyces sp. Mi166|nr:hypothetical protein C0995_000204 [Termitomyces sp. Mi166\